MPQTHTALVLGATGNIGSEVAQRLAVRGWAVRALHRHPAGLAHRGDDIEWLRGDALIREDVVAAARGAALIVHAVNPPGYRNWAATVLPMMDNSIAAARASGARILLPGTLYNYGPDAFPLLSEASPQRPLTRKGAIRAELENRLRAAAPTGVRSLVVRAGDYFGGSGAGNNWFSGGLVKPGKPLRGVTYPGQPGVGHQWAYVPDVAETMVRLLERADQLGAAATYHMHGHWDADGTRMIEAIRRAAGRPALKVHAFPWWALPLLSPFSELMRELREMRYLWRTPLRMDNARLQEMLGKEPHTPWDDAVQAALAPLRCL